MTDQTVRLVFLGEAGQALRTQDAVTTNTKKMAAADREQVQASKQVETQTRRTRAELAQTEAQLGKTVRGAIAGSGAFRGLGRSIAFASSTFLGGFGLTYAIRTAVDEMQQAAVVGAQTSAVIRSTGGAAGVSAKQIDVLAQALLRKSGYDDEAIKSAENLLLTFTEVRNEVGKGNDIFDLAAKATVDMARALNVDLSSAALQLGKALNDPVTGMTALRRAGVSFTTSQREQIKALVESNQLLAAQKIIIAEVTKEFGGSAAAFGRTGAGQIAIFREELRNLAGTYAETLTPEIHDATEAAQTWVDELEKDPAKREAFRRDVVGIAAAVKTAGGVLHQTTDAVGGTKNAIELLIALKALSWLGGLKAGLSGLIGAEAAGAGAGAGFLGAAGAAGTLRLALSRIPAVTVATIVLEVIDKTTGKKLSNWLFRDERNPIVWLEHQIMKLAGVDTGTSTPAAPSGAQYTGKGGHGGTQFIAAGSGEKRFVPRGSNPTVGALHPTAGLAGFPAHDIFVKPGTPVLAPEDGAITRLSGHDPSQGSSGAAGILGYSIYFVGDSGTTYFMTHLAQVAPEGRYAKGQEIGTVAYHPRGSHVHVGQYAGNAQAAYAPSTVKANLGTGGTGGRPPRTHPHPTGPTNRQQLELALAQAGVTPGSGDDRAALQALIAFVQAKLAGKNVPVTTRISLLQEQAGYLSQLDALKTTPKKPKGLASPAALVNAHHLLDIVGGLVDKAGLDKRFDPQLAKINAELGSKFVTTETLAKIRIQLGKIADVAKAAIDNAANLVKARKQAFTDAWAQLASDALDAFDKETASHVGPTRSLINTLTGAHDKAAIEDAVTAAKKALDDALAGKNAEADSDILSRVRELVGKSALANAIDKAQSQILGGSPAEISGGTLISQLQDLLQAGSTVDQDAVAAAQKAYDESLYQQKLYYLGLEADAEDSAYTDGRARLRSALEKQLAEWGKYYASIGKGAADAAALFQAIWDRVLRQYPINVGGTGGGVNQPGGNVAGNLASLVTGSQTAILTGGPMGAYVVRGGAIAMAGGGEGVVAKPTLFLAGEAGREHVKFTPMGSSTGGGVEHSVVHLSLGGPLDELVEAKVLQLTPSVSLAIGKEASIRARAGRY